MLEIKIDGVQKLNAAAEGISKSREVISDLLYKEAGEFGDRAVRTITSKFMGVAGKLHIRTGRLMSSIKQFTAQAGDLTTTVIGTDVPYAAIHEFGGMTGRKHRTKIPARPYLAPGTEAEIPRFRQMIDELLKRAVTDGIARGQ